jgi:hypothetical protein
VADQDDPVAAPLAELVHLWSDASLDSSGPASEEEIEAAEKELGVSFPRSYRAFLRRYGAGNLHHYEIFGLPGNRLWADIVMMNQLSRGTVPKQYLKFTNDIGDFAYYLDTSQMDGNGECPVVVIGPGEDGETVADSFLDFLRRASQGSI